MVSIWNPLTFSFKPYITCAGILLKGNIRGFEKQLNLLNVYAPYKERKVYWDKVDASGLLNLGNLILAGDLNLTLHSFENWETMFPSNLLEDYFVDIFNKNQLIDIAPSKITPT